DVSRDPRQAARAPHRSHRCARGRDHRDPGLQVESRRTAGRFARGPPARRAASAVRDEPRGAAGRGRARRAARGPRRLCGRVDARRLSRASRAPRTDLRSRRGVARRPRPARRGVCGGRRANLRCRRGRGGGSFRSVDSGVRAARAPGGLGSRRRRSAGVSDAHIRERALDPTESFIVQAPAGSGKTELLIRRYLTLLAHVDEPEQIVAITFTRKAAAEMRQRVAQALVDASAAEVSSQPHREATLAIARRVLERSRARGWALPDHAERLWIETVDALNARLARQLPVLAGGVSGAGVVDDASELYRVAARRTVDALTDPSL